MDVDVVVAGAGAVGLAIAAAFARAGEDVLVLEAAAAIGKGISSRNSEVVHAGMYYPTGSLRQRMCVAGRRQLYAYLDQRGVAYRKYGKLIVATSEREVARIEAIYATGQRNGVEGLELVSAAIVRAWEPQLACAAALWSPETGVVDGHGYMLALRGEVEDHGGVIALNAPVERIAQLAGGGFRVTTGGEEAATLTCRLVVNSGGLHAQRVAQSIRDFPAEHVPKLVLAKGSYFACNGRQADRKSVM